MQPSLPLITKPMRKRFIHLLIMLAGAVAAGPDISTDTFFDQHCIECHDAETKKGRLDLTQLKADYTDADTFATWVKIHDRIDTGEMPPKKKKRPPEDARKALVKTLYDTLVKADQDLQQSGRPRLRRLTRVEYQHTIRDLFDMPGLALSEILPPDGSAHGFDKLSDALDLSHVNLAKYMEAADHILDLAIATQPEAPQVRTQRLSLAERGGFVAHILMRGDGVMLRDKKIDPEFPPAGKYDHIDQGAHERIGTFDRNSTVGLFRPEDESFSPYFASHVTIYPGTYRLRTSLWSFQWDKGQVLPSRGIEAGRLSVVQLTGDGRGGQHPSYVLGYFDAPSMDAREHEMDVWLNRNEIIGFNTASIARAHTRGELRAMGYTGPGIACDWLDIEGPLHDLWPPRAHRLIFGELPLQQWDTAAKSRKPIRKKVRKIGAGINRPDPDPGLWTVHSEAPLVDADRLLADFLPRAFRRPVSDELRKNYLDHVGKRLEADDCFESAMRWAYRAALCSPDFLFHLENEGPLDAFALASRLSYFLGNTQPDAHMVELARSGGLHASLHDEVERLLNAPSSQRFIEDFLGQWLSLYKIAANDPDRKLYPEFDAYLQDSMIAETHAYFRELLDKDLGVHHLIQSDFAMLNERLAVHYGIPDVKGTTTRRVALPADCPRGGFLTHASVLKITANGTTTSPVPRGAFVLDRLLGKPPEPPPPNIPAIEPDVRGASTIREQLDKHRADPSCASCHKHIDPPGFALESFDVIGGFRTRYRSIGEGEPAPRGAIDPAIGISFKLGPAVDASGELPDGRSFEQVQGMQKLLLSDEDALAENLTRQLAVYACGRAMGFRDRSAIAEIVSEAQKSGGGVRSLIHALVQHPLFQSKEP
ncbi:MAG: hypothetical protein ACI9TH_002508 [Kiritimatiellia bacterium]|jgi:hypothetical protein